MFSMELPLSWARSNKTRVHNKAIRLKSTKLHWISLAEVPEQTHFEKIISRIQKSFPQGILIRGCTPEIANKLSKKKFEIIPIGQEAILDLNKNVFEKKSLRELINRGSKKVTIKKVKFNPKNKHKLEKLKKNSVHGKKPQLKNLFIDSFKNNTDCFVCETKNGDWIAAITCSQVNTQKVQTELLIRKANAPNGVMEALIKFVFSYLKNIGYNLWSLGEVPFSADPKAHITWKSKLIKYSGKKLTIVYKSQSLYNFKNKFNPTWQPVYLCGYPKISILSVLEMAWRCNYLKLFVHEVLRYVVNTLVEKIFAGRGINKLKIGNFPFRTTRIKL